MIPDTARYHGSFFTLLLDNLDEPASFKKLQDMGSGYYLVNEKLPIALKATSKRQGPWIFNFLRNHQQSLSTLESKYGELFICLICGRDGVAGLNMREFRELLVENFQEQGIITVRRKLRTMYNVSGRGGELRHRIGRQDIFEKIKKSIIRSPEE